MVSKRTIWRIGDRIYEIKTNGNKYTYIHLDEEFNPITGDIFTSDQAPKILVKKVERGGEQIIYSPVSETGETVQEGGKSRKKRKHKRKSTRKRRRTTPKHDY
jgi:hypothetical protein